MRSLKAIAPLIGSALLAVIGVAAVAVAFQSKGQAQDSLESALRLRQARIDVAEAQEALGGSDIDDAVASGEEANAVALRVGERTDRIAALLEPMQDSAARSVSEGRRGIRGAVAARRQTEIAADVLAALAAYQRAAGENASITNKALRRILIALRETNEDSP
jgi:hypothetical protein